LVAGEVVRGVVAILSRPNTGSNIEVAKPQMFNRKASKVLGFLTLCRLNIRINIRETIVEKQIQ